MPKLAPPPPRPALVLRVGVVGNRKLDLDDSARAGLRQHVRGLFDSLRRLVATVGAEPHVYAPDPPVLRIVSGLADGADHVLTVAGLDAGANELLAVLPFTPDEYERTIADKAEYRRLLGAAASVLVLDGQYTDESNAEPVARRGRQRAYRGQAWFTLQQSDLLVALWDPRAEGRAGGTEETLRAALRQGVPVVWIDPRAANEHYLLSDPEALDDDRIIGDRPAWSAAWHADGAQLSKRILAVLRFPESAPGPGEKHALRPTEVIEEYLGEHRPRLNAFQRCGRHLMAWWWNVVTRTLGRGAFEKRLVAKAEPVPAYVGYEKRASGLAAHYAALYRGAFLTNNCLAFLTVLLAAVGGILWAGLLRPEIGGSALTLPIIALTEIAAIALIVYVHWRARRARWHDRWLDYRLLAELLRSMRYLAPLAGAAPSSRLPAVHAANDPRGSWTYWLFRAIVRGAPLAVKKHPDPPALGLRRETAVYYFPPEYLDECLRRVREDWVPDQINHHGQTSARMGRTHERLEAAMHGAFALALGCVVVYVLARVFDAYDVSGEKWLKLAAVVLPALALCLAGFRDQLECRRLHGRSATMVSQLELALAAFDRLAASPLRAEGGWAFPIAVETNRLAQMMIDEVADWRIVYQIHEVPV